MGYHVGDIPAADLVIEPLREEQPVDLTPYDGVEASLWLDGDEVLTPGMLATIDNGLIVVEWPTTTVFDEAGIYELRLTAVNDIEGTRERLPLVYLVADTDDGWHTLDSARNAWPDAPPYDAWLYELLVVAKQQVLDYAPKLEAGARPPVNYRKAQLMQCRNLWNATKVDPASGGMGDDSFVIQPFPLDWMVKQVLRPKTGVPVVG